MEGENTVTTKWVPCSTAEGRAVLDSFPWEERMSRARSATDIALIIEARRNARDELSKCIEEDGAVASDGMHVFMICGSLALASTGWMARKGRPLSAVAITAVFAPMMTTTFYGWWAQPIVNRNGPDVRYPAALSPHLSWFPHALTIVYKQPVLLRATNTETPLFTQKQSKWTSRLQ